MLSLLLVTASITVLPGYVNSLVDVALRDGAALLGNR
jgi:hypothetical protein